MRVSYIFAYISFQQFSTAFYIKQYSKVQMSVVPCSSIGVGIRANNKCSSNWVSRAESEITTAFVVKQQFSRKPGIYLLKARNLQVQLFRKLKRNQANSEKKNKFICVEIYQINRQIYIV